MASNTTPTKVVTYQALNGALTRLKGRLNPVVSAHQNIGEISIKLDKNTGTVELLGFTVDITGSQLHNSVTAFIYNTNLSNLRRECDGMVIAKMEDACLVAFSLAENPHGVDGVLLAKLDRAGENRLFLIKPGSCVTSDDLTPLTSGLTNVNKRIDDIKNIIEGNKVETYVSFVYDFNTKTFSLDECVGEWENIPVHNKLLIPLITLEGVINNTDLYGTVLSNSPESILIAFSVAENDCNMNATVLAHCDKALGNWSFNILKGGVMATVEDLNKVAADVETLKTNTNSGPKTWDGGMLNYVENSEEYTPVQSHFNWNDLDNVRIGDAVEFEIRQDPWTMGKLVGMVYSIEYNISIQASGRTRAGFTVLLDPFFGTSWKYRQLKIRFTEDKDMIVYDI